MSISTLPTELKRGQELEMCHFRGFISHQADVVTIRPSFRSNNVNVTLSNVDPCVRDNTPGNQINVMAAFAKAVMQFINDNRVDVIWVKLWDFPCKDNEMVKVISKKKQEAEAFQSEQVDNIKATIARFIGIVKLGYQDGNGIRKWKDIRTIGIGIGALKLNDRAKFYDNHNDSEANGKELRDAAARSSTPFFKNYTDLRQLRDSSMALRSAYEACIPVPEHMVGKVLGGKHATKLSLQKEFDVRISFEDHRFKVIGSDPDNVENAAVQIAEIARVPDDHIRLEHGGEQSLNDIFLGVKGTKLPMTIIGSKSILTYTVLCDSQVHGQLLLQLELLGIHTISVQANIDSWVNHSLFRPLLEECNRVSGHVVGKSGSLSCEAMGFSQGNKTNNMFGLLFINEDKGERGKEEGGEGEEEEEEEERGGGGKTAGGACKLDRALSVSEQCLNALVLRQGLGKVLQQSTYYDPVCKGRDTSIRSFLPYLTPVLSREPERMARAGAGAGPGTIHDVANIGWSHMERELLLAEHEACQYKRGLWQQHTELNSLLPERAPGTRRHVFIDNSNIWISGMHLSGELKRLGFLNALEKSDRMNQRFHDQCRQKPAAELPVVGNDEKRRLILAEIRAKHSLQVFTGFDKKKNRPYCMSDHTWRLDYARLLRLVGFDVDVDESFTISGSVPPYNEDIWTRLRELGATNTLTKRTVDGIASSEDTRLTAAMSNDIVNAKHQKINTKTDGRTDEVVLLAGDRGFVGTVEDIRKTYPEMKIYIVAWATTACYNRMKQMNDSNTYFIALDPYLECLALNSASIKELWSKTAIEDAGRDERLLNISHQSKGKKIDKSAVIKEVENSVDGLLHERDFLIKTSSSIIFTSNSQQNFPGSMQIAKQAIDKYFEAKKAKEENSRGCGRRVFHQKATTGSIRASINIFTAFLDSDDEDDEDDVEPVKEEDEEQDDTVDDNEMIDY